MGEKKMKNQLTLLADKFGCDKGSIKHNYTKQYHKYFKELQNQTFRMLEIGLGQGASAKMWLEYFPKVTLYCTDIFEELPEDKLLLKYTEENRFKYFTAEQSSKEQTVGIIDGRKKFKIIVDDGSHVPEDQQFSLGYLFPLLSKGGLYVIEDLNYKRNPNPKFPVPAEKTREVLRRYKDHGIFNSNVLTEDQISYINNNIAKIAIINNSKISFITKR